jgi:hypothetical protein
MSRALTEVLGPELEFLFAGRTAAVEKFLQDDPGAKNAKFVKLGASGRIMTVEDFQKED